MKYYLLIFILFSNFAQAISFEDIMKEERRPTLELNFALDEHGAKLASVRQSEWEIADNSAIYNLYERLIVEILKRLPERDVFLMSRDMDDLYDAFMAAVQHHDSTHVLASRVHHLEVSRRVALSSNDSQLSNWMLLQGFDIERIIRGDKKAFVLDTGYKSKIFNAIHALAFRKLDQMTRDVSRGLDLLENLDARLLSSWHTNTSVPRLIANLRNRQYQNLKQVSDLFVPEKFFFDEIIPSHQDWLAIGIEPDVGRDHWLINRLERAHRHWRPRILKLNDEGTGPALIEDIDERDSRVDRRFVLYYQRRLYAHFNTPEVQQRLRPAILMALEEIRKLNPSEVSLGQTPPSLSENVMAKSMIAIPILGEQSMTPTGTKLEVEELIHDGKDTLIFKVKDLSGSHLVLKVAKTQSEEDLESLHRTRKRLEKLKDLGVNVADVIEYGDNFILKRWVEGVTGLSLLDSLNRGEPNGWLNEFIRFISQMADRGIYVSNLSPSNIILGPDERFTIIDSSTVQEMAPDTAREKYRDSLARRWIKRARTKDCEKILEGLLQW